MARSRLRGRPGRGQRGAAPVQAARYAAQQGGCARLRRRSRLPACSRGPPTPLTTRTLCTTCGLAQVDRSKDQLFFASEASLTYLDGTLPGDFGFDPLGLVREPSTLVGRGAARIIPECSKMDRTVSAAGSQHVCRPFGTMVPHLARATRRGSKQSTSLGVCIPRLWRSQGAKSVHGLWAESHWRSQPVCIATRAVSSAAGPGELWRLHHPGVAAVL
mgnify:CR=1 FL=1